MKNKRLYKARKASMKTPEVSCGSLPLILVFANKNKPSKPRDIYNQYPCGYSTGKALAQGIHGAVWGHLLVLWYRVDQCVAVGTCVLMNIHGNLLTSYCIYTTLLSAMQEESYVDFWTWQFKLFICLSSLIGNLTYIQNNFLFVTMFHYQNNYSYIGLYKYDKIYLIFLSWNNWTLKPRKLACFIKQSSYIREPKSMSSYLGKILNFSG